MYVEKINVHILIDFIEHFARKKLASGLSEATIQHL